MTNIFSKKFILLLIVAFSFSSSGFPLSPPMTRHLGIIEIQAKFDKKSLDQIVKERVSKGIEPQTKVCLGDAASEIVGTANEENIDLIVIATHGLTGWRRFMFGSVAEKVVRLAGCAVLTIREPGGE